ncbi:MAG TPA: AGE family epimerase/isomerase [Acetobacteraceae bacterium]
MNSTLASAQNWLIDHSWPLWLHEGVDWQARAFHESLHPDAPDSPPPAFRRLRVAARQTYVFSHAALAGLPRAHEAVELGLAFLRTHARQRDGGYAMRFGLDNAPIDQTRDLYDLAFVLFGYAHAARAIDDGVLARDARGVLAFIDTHMTHPEGGYRESLPDQLPRRQNPHMHLLEAVLAAYVSFADPNYLDHADMLVDLLLDRLLNHEAGALPEFFDETLQPIRDPEARFPVEPGHHFEWVWLLDSYVRIATDAGRPVRDIDIESAIRVLMSTAERRGIDPANGLVLDVITDDGAVHQRGFRIWPQTERLKAALRRPDLARTDAASCLALLQSYFRADRPGLWHERMGTDGPIAGLPAPASSLYHLTCALLETTAI